MQSQDVVRLGGLEVDLPYPLCFQTDGKEKEVDLQYIPGVMGPPGPQVTINCCHIIITATYCLIDLIPVFFVFFSLKGPQGISGLPVRL